MSVIKKPVDGFKNQWQIRTKNFLRGLIWYAWGLWQAILSNFDENCLKINISKHRGYRAMNENLFFLLNSILC